jgi:hypothetical protein
MKMQGKHPQVMENLQKDERTGKTPVKNLPEELKKKTNKISKKTYQEFVKRRINIHNQEPTKE